MASGNFVLDKGYNAGAPITKFTAVKKSKTDPETVVPVTANDDIVLGWSQFEVTQDEIDRGKGCSVRLLGITEAVAAGAIEDGDVCQLEANGKVVTAVNSSGAREVGVCVGHASTTDGDRISMFVNPFGDLAAGVTS